VMRLLEKRHNSEFRKTLPKMRCPLVQRTWPSSGSAGVPESASALWWRGGRRHRSASSCNSGTPCTRAAAAPRGRDGAQSATASRLDDPKPLSHLSKVTNSDSLKRKALSSERWWFCRGTSRCARAETPSGLRWKSSEWDGPWPSRTPRHRAGRAERRTPRRRRSSSFRWPVLARTCSPVWSDNQRPFSAPRPGLKCRKTRNRVAHNASQITDRQPCPRHWRRACCRGRAPRRMRWPRPASTSRRRARGGRRHRGGRAAAPPSRARRVRAWRRAPAWTRCWAAADPRPHRPPASWATCAATTRSRWSPAAQSSPSGWTKQ